MKAVLAAFNQEKALVAASYVIGKTARTPVSSFAPDRVVTVRCVQVCSSPELGRYLVATRDLKPGEMIISETPLVMGPQAVTIPVCLACYKPATSKYV